MAWAHVGTSAVNSTTASTTGTVTYTGVTAGHMVLVCISNVGTSSVSSIADSGSNTWTLVNNENANNIDNTMYYSLITTGGNLTITATMSGTTAIVTMTADEYSFTAGTLSVGNVATNNDVASTGWTTGSLAFTKTCLVVGSVSTNNPAASDTWTSPLTHRNGVAEVPGTSFGLFVGDVLNTVATPINPSGTWGTGGTNYCSSGAVFLSSGDNLASGTASTTSSGNTIATVTVANATGGLSGYTYQWYRSTTTGFTPGGGNIVSGATSQTLNDTGLTNGTTYFYKNIVTDSASVTSTSNQTSATPSGATLAVSPTSVVQNSTGLTLTLTGVGTSWTPGTPGSPTFTVSAGTKTAQTVASTTSATLTYNSPTTASSPVTITDPSTGATASLTIAASSLANGTASTVSTGSTIATVTVTNATGGTSPYTYQWYRSTTTGFTPGGGNIVAGATSQTLNDTGLTNGTTYYYVNVVTDSA